ncbi:MAG TPA: carboxypeptidase regulatory-like domain-containing protein [Candidatus Angelobacter sp.]
MSLRIAWCIPIALVLAAAAQQKPGAAPPPAAGQVDFQISGTLVDAVTGQPVAHARVAVAPVSQRDNFTTMVTAEDGRFSFLNLAPGKYTLTAQARGYLLQSFNQHDQYSSSIVVGPNLESTDLLFRLPPEGSIAGVITDEAGEPVRDAQVLLYQTGVSFGSEGTRLRNRAVSNDEGAYRFSHLAPGRYLIAVAATPWYAQRPMPRPQTAATSGGTGKVMIQSTFGAHGGAEGEPGHVPLDVAYPVTFYSGVTEAGAATPIVLGRGERVTANFNLQPVPALHVTVNLDETEPGKTNYISLQQRVLDGPPVQMRTETRRIGAKTVEIVGIPAGHYTIRDYIAGSGAPAEWGDSRDVDVTSSGEIGVNQGRQYVPVTATFQLDSGKLPVQAVLQLTAKKTREGFGERIGAAGEIKFKQGVPPGAYEVSLGGAPGLYIKSISAPGATVIGRTLEVRSAASLKLTIAVTHGEAVVTGTALRDGKPLPGAMIVLAPADPTHNQVLFRRDQSDSDGTFKLSEVVPGKYTVVAIENGWDLEWMNVDVLKSYMAQGVAVQALQNGKYDVKVTVQ